MKLAISGKGGVGKTTLAALISQEFGERGYDVLAIDADPSPCLAEVMGFPENLLEKLSPIAEMDSFVFSGFQKKHLRIINQLTVFISIIFLIKLCVPNMQKAILSYNQNKKTTWKDDPGDYPRSDGA